MAEAAVSITLQILGDLLLEEAKFLCGVGSKVKKLQIQLKEMKYLLEDAEQKQDKNKTVCNWITEIKDLAYSAEDVIETYVVQVSYNQEMGLKQICKRFSCVCFSGGFLLPGIGSEISRIVSEFTRVKKSMQEYGLRSIIEGGSSSCEDENERWRRQSYAIEDCFVGKEDELKRLVSIILDENAKVDRVISVWGMGGIGKTTICRKVYNDVEVKRRFELFAWVCVTQKCPIRLVLEDVLKQLNRGKRENVVSLSDRELIEELWIVQKAKRCMIVVDDLWEKDHWNCLKHAFLAEDLSSKILITTRKRSVAEVGFGFELGLLSVDDGWEILKKKAFRRDSNLVEENSRRKIGKEMVHKCGYLPLVISLLGGVLSKKKSIEEWESVNNNIHTYLYRGEGLQKENEIHGVLSLSYEDLPYFLKPCFLYMGQFREDQTIYVRTLYRLWIAQRMISSDHNQGDDETTLMDIAELYLTELASRSLVQVQVEDEVRDQKYSTCRLHDVVRSLCLAKGKSEDFGLQIIENYQGGNLRTLLGCKTRHLAIHCNDQVEVMMQSDGSGKYVRSLQFINVASGKKVEFPHDILDFQKFKLLRVLLIHGCKFKGRKLPRGIANLVHLKYLGLFYCVLDKLSSSISSLSYLYSLDLLGSWNVRVPNALNKMHRLKHLILPYYDREKTGEYRLQLEGLEELEILYGFNSLVHDLKSVTRMKNLRRFEAIAHDNESLSAIINAVMTTWKKLRFFKLVIKQGCEFTTEQGLKILKEAFACQNLHDLRIHVHVGRLIHECRSEMIGSRLVRLQLMDCEIEDDPMEKLGKLPLLEQLFLSKRSFVGDKMKCDAMGFPCLKNLVLKLLPNLREWIVQEGALCVVSEIEISHCSRLEMVPDGFRFMTTLQKLKICGMPELGRRVLASSDGGREGEDFHKVRRVPFITIVE